VAVLVVLVVHVSQSAGHNISKFTSSPPISAATLQSVVEKDWHKGGSGAPLQLAIEVVTVVDVFVTAVVVSVALVAVVTVAVVVDVGHD
jgi:1,6-anhydro-N-acetylmuramate kinase